MSFKQFKNKLKLIESKLFEGGGSGVRVTSDGGLTIKLLFSSKDNKVTKNVIADDRLTFKGYEESAEVDGRILDWTDTSEDTKGLDMFVESFYKLSLEEFTENMKTEILASILNYDISELEDKMTSLIESNATLKEFMDEFPKLNFNFEINITASVNEVISHGWSRSVYKVGDVIISENEIEDMEVIVSVEDGGDISQVSYTNYIYDSSVLDYDGVVATGRATQDFVQMWSDVFVDNDEYEEYDWSDVIQYWNDWEPGMTETSESVEHEPLDNYIDKGATGRMIEEYFDSQVIIDKKGDVYIASLDIPFEDLDTESPSRIGAKMGLLTKYKEKVRQNPDLLDYVIEKVEYEEDKKKAYSKYYESKI